MLHSLREGPHTRISEGSEAQRARGSGLKVTQAGRAKTGYLELNANPSPGLPQVADTLQGPRGGHWGLGV